MVNTNLLKAKMVQQEITQEELAKKLDLYVTTTHNKITGKNEFKASELAKLKQILILTDAEFMNIFFAQ